MAASIIQTAHTDASGGAATTVTATFGSAVGTGNTIVGIVRYDFGQTITSIKDNNNVSATISDTASDSGFGIASTFYLGNSSGAPTAITVICGASFVLDLVINEAAGVLAASDPRDGHTAQFLAAPGTGADALTSGNITTSVNGDLIWSGVNNNSGVTIGTGFTASGNFGDTFTTIGAEWKVQTTAGTTAGTWTSTGGTNGIVGVIALQPAAVASALPPPVFTDSEIYQVRRTALIY